jgi:signal peptidase I
VTASIKKALKNGNVQTIILIALVAVVVGGFYLVEQAGYIAVVPSGSMCIPYGGACDGWTHPFDRTLHVGDILIIQPINPKDLNTDYPNSDVIVYHNPQKPSELIVHRIAASTEVNGELAFYTKGDGNGWDKWPNPISPSEYDPWSPVPQDLIVGKVILRIPWVGWVSIIMQSTGANNTIVIPVIILLIIALIVSEFVVPLLKRKQTSQNQLQPSPS